ncbi:helix-turn-helix domain-containing protein [Mediterraneibacter agrestimuris]|uniref:helix-turn-helix domain-containing protein n=1 Tax=Mediterraneibacter agrestimuris TaxID=2941333 RepID=UPI002041AF03|nr:helix-turn-helix transcriptional regulator [Mediterraneibacter agrestimuris]
MNSRSKFDCVNRDCKADETQKEERLYMEIGERLRKFRREIDYTQEQMAEILGISTAYYGKIERGVYCLSIKRLWTLNQKLEIDITYLITGIQKPMLSLDCIVDDWSASKKYDMEQIINHLISLGTND